MSGARPAGHLLLGTALLTFAAAACSSSRDLARADFEPATDGVLHVATALPAAGFWEGDDPAAVHGGFEWGLAEALADRFDLRLEIVDLPFARIAGSDLGGADMAIAQVSITDARGEDLDFSTPYYETAPGVLAATGEEIADLATAKERRWVAVEGTTEADYLDDIVEPDDPWSAVADEAAAAAAVAAGDADAALIDLPVALVLADRVDGLDVVARFPTSERYGVALPDGSRVNREAVDQAIRAFEADGTIADLEEEWLRPAFGRDPSGLPVIRVADQ